MTKKAIILLSGGLDSSTCAAIAKSQGFQLHAISFNYGQRSQLEIAAAKQVCEMLEISEHKIFNIDIKQFGGSALTDPSLAIPEESTDDIPITYVPVRNTVFLSLALGWGEVIGARDIFIGATVIDYSGYPDCRPEYLQQFEKLANLATKAGVEGDSFHIHAPLLYLSKADIICEGIRLGVDYAVTCSCYDADEFGRACRRCDSCRQRAEGFQQANIPDPTRYC